MMPGLTKNQLLIHLTFLGGSTAYGAGAPIDTNPWETGTEEHGAWTAGWLDAHIDAEVRKTLDVDQNN